MLRLQPDDPLVARFLTPEDRARLGKSRAKKPKRDYELEIKLHLEAHGLGLGMRTQFRFAPHRKYAFDFAWPEFKIGLEFEGLIVTRDAKGHTQLGGRHATITGMREDMRKYNLAAKLGWRVLRYERSLLRDGTLCADVAEILILARGKQ